MARSCRDGASGCVVHGVLQVSCDGKRAEFWPLESWGEWPTKEGPQLGPPVCGWMFYGRLLGCCGKLHGVQVGRGWTIHPRAACRTSVRAESDFPKLVYSHRKEQRKDVKYQSIFVLVASHSSALFKRFN